MKKLIIVFLATILLFTALACASGSSTPENRGTLTVCYDRELTGELLAYFQANQNVIVTGTLLDSKTDYSALTSAVALLKDTATAEKLLAAGWTEVQNWNEAQQQTNAELFAYTAYLSPKATDTDKSACRYLTDWLVGEGSYTRTITTASGGCSCKRVETTVTMKSDAPALYKSGLFDALNN